MSQILQRCSAHTVVRNPVEVKETTEENFILEATVLQVRLGRLVNLNDSKPTLLLATLRSS